MSRAKRRSTINRGEREGKSRKRVSSSSFPLLSSPSTNLDFNIIFKAFFLCIYFSKFIDVLSGRHIFLRINFKVYILYPSSLSILKID